MALRGPLSLCLESPVGIGEKLSWRVVAAPVLLWSDGHTREGQRGDTFLFSPPKAEERSRTMGLGILPLVMGVGGPLHPLDLSEFSNLIALRQKNHTHIGGDGGGVGNPRVAVSMNASDGIGRKAKLGKGQQIQPRYISK